MYLLIGGWGGERRVYAAVKFFLYTMAGSAFLLVVDPVPVRADGRDHVRPARRWPTRLRRCRSRRHDGCSSAFFVAFAVKVPMFPLHTWLPDAHTEAPTAGSVLLAGVLLKVGAYGLIRFNMALFPEAAKHFATPISVLAVIGIIYGAVCALGQRDVKRLVAYSSVSHLGFVVLGVFALTQQAVTGGVLQMVNHGLATGALFLLVGMVYDRTHTRGSTRWAGSRVDAVAAGLLPVRGVRLCGAAGAEQLRRGVPGDRRDVRGEPRGSDRSPRSRWCSARSTCCGPTSGWPTARSDDEHRALRDVSAREVLVIVPVLALLLVFGVYPRLMTDSIDPATTQVVEHVSPDHATTVVPAVQAAAARGAADDRAGAALSPRRATRPRATGPDAPIPTPVLVFQPVDARDHPVRGVAIARAALRGLRAEELADRPSRVRAGRARRRRRSPRSSCGTGAAPRRCSATRSPPTGSRWSRPSCS